MKFSKIVILDGKVLNPGDNPWSPVEALGEACVVYDHTPSERVVERCRGADVVLTNKTVLTGAMLRQLPDVRVVGVLATGYDVVDVSAAQELDLPVLNVPEYGSDEVAQHVFALMLSWMHRPEAHHEAIQDGEWGRRGEFAFWLRAPESLRGRTLGLVGLGHIGKRVAEIGRAFGMRVCAYRRSDTPEDGVELVSLRGVLEASDVVSLHCPLNDATRHLIRSETLQWMKPSALLINTARGGLIHEPDLAYSLKQNTLAGYAADVVSREPIVDENPLLRAPNVLLTPHMAWSSLRARQRLIRITAENLAGVLRGDVQNCVYA